MIEVRVYQGSSVMEGVDTEKISDHVEDPACLLWVDVVEPTEDNLASLQDEFAECRPGLVLVPARQGQQPLRTFGAALARAGGYVPSAPRRLDQ